MDRITNNIYLGDLNDASRHEWLRDGSPTAVLKLTASDPREAYPESITVVEVPLIDGPQNEYDEFCEATHSLLELLDADHTVFVHCAAGVSRSVAVTAATIAIIENTTVDEALEHIKTQRQIASPHPHLHSQAEKFVSEW